MEKEQSKMVRLSKDLCQKIAKKGQYGDSMNQIISRIYDKAYPNPRKQNVVQKTQNKQNRQSIQRLQDGKKSKDMDPDDIARETY